MKKIFAALTATLLMSSAALAASSASFLAREGLMSALVINTGTNTMYSYAPGFPGMLFSGERDYYTVDLFPGQSITVDYDMNDLGDLCTVNFYNRGASGSSSFERIDVTVYGGNWDTDCEVDSKGNLRFGSWVSSWDNCWNDVFCMKGKSGNSKAKASAHSLSVAKKHTKPAA